MKFSKGFTLIELLVVIAIIGILSSVVLASLNTARAKGSNAAIKSQLAAIRPQAEIWYDTNGNYGTSTVGSLPLTALAATGCNSGSLTNTIFNDPTIINQVKGVLNTAGTGNVLCSVAPTTVNTSWAVDAVLKVAEGTTLYWCVDSTGASKGEPSGSRVTTTAVCP